MGVGGNRKSTQHSYAASENSVNKIFHTKTPIPRGTYPRDVFTKCTKDPGFLFPRECAAYVVGADAVVEIVAEPGFVPIVNFIPTTEGSYVAALRTRLAVEQVDSPSRTKRRTSASKRERVPISSSRRWGRDSAGVEWGDAVAEARGSGDATTLVS